MYAMDIIENDGIGIIDSMPKPANTPSIAMTTDMINTTFVGALRFMGISLP